MIELLDLFLMAASLIFGIICGVLGSIHYILNNPQEFREKVGEQFA